MKKKIGNTSDAKDGRLLTEREAAEFLGISPSTLESWRRQGRVPYVALGGGKKPRIRYRLEVLKRWVDQFERAAVN